MDEPLSNLDAKLRVQMRAEISHVQRRLGVAAFYVTHDQTEAMTMGDRVAVLRSGRLQQCDRPQVLYDRPANVFVAAFIGSPAMNLYEGHLLEGGEALKLGSQTLPLPPDVHQQRPGLRAYAGKDLLVGVRPEHVTDAALDNEDRGGASLDAEIRLIEALGSELMVHFRLDAARVHTDDTAAASEDQELEASAAATEVSSYADGVARVDSRSQITGRRHGPVRGHDRPAAFLRPGLPRGDLSRGAAAGRAARPRPRHSSCMLDMPHRVVRTPGGWLSTVRIAAATSSGSSIVSSSSDSASRPRPMAKRGPDAARAQRRDADAPLADLEVEACRPATSGPLWWPHRRPRRRSPSAPPRS